MVVEVPERPSSGVGVLGDTLSESEACHIQVVRFQRNLQTSDSSRHTSRGQHEVPIVVRIVQYDMRVCRECQYVRRLKFELELVWSHRFVYFACILGKRDEGGDNFELFGPDDVHFSKRHCCVMLVCVRKIELWWMTFGERGGEEFHCYTFSTRKFGATR